MESYIIRDKQFKKWMRVQLGLDLGLKAVTEMAL